MPDRREFLGAVAGAVAGAMVPAAPLTLCGVPLVFDTAGEPEPLYLTNQDVGLIVYKNCHFMGPSAALLGLAGAGCVFRNCTFTTEDGRLVHLHDSKAVDKSA